MRCPYCGTNRDKVIDSRASEGGRAIRRRRQCLGCEQRFTTYEHVEQQRRLWVIKKDGTRVPYSREKLLAGLEKACYKRPVAAEQLNKLVDEVEEELLSSPEQEVESVEIGRLASDRLKRIDQVAYVRFASVYKQFRDLDELLQEVREVIGSTDVERPGQGKLFR